MARQTSHMVERLDELGIAGWLDDEARARLATHDVDVDAIHSIGIAGAITPALLLRIAEVGSHEVASLVHELGAAGPWKPEQLEALLSLEPSRTRHLVHANGWSGEDPAVLVRRLLAAGDSD